jgi:hypothetical protein
MVEYKKVIEDFVKELNLISDKRIDKIEIRLPDKVFERLSSEFSFLMDGNMLKTISINSIYGTTINIRRVEYEEDDYIKRAEYAESKLDEIDRNWWKTDKI